MCAILADTMRYVYRFDQLDMDTKMPISAGVQGYACDTAQRNNWRLVLAYDGLSFSTRFPTIMLS